jgi:LDH2 family malate/lactate/ureidoglycolate dehydrogenase
LIKENYGVFVPGKRGEPEYIRKTKVSTLINGHNNPGMLIASLAFSPDLLSDASTLKQSAQEFIAVLKNAPTQDGKEVRIPGERTLKFAIVMYC